MAENIRQAKSYTMTVTFEIIYNNKPDDPHNRPVSVKLTSKQYWLTPGSIRSDETKDEHWQYGPMTSTTIRPAGKPGIEINHKTKTFCRLPLERKYDLPLLALEKFRGLSGDADRKLGTREVGGKKAWGFEIDGLKIDPEAYAGPVEIWIDTETNLPISVRYKMRPVVGPIMNLTMEEFQWNVDLDPKLFDTEPPEGYVKKTPTSKPEKPEELLQGITLALKTYAELCGGHFPRVTRMFAEPVRDEMYKAAGIDYPPTTKQIKSKQYKRVLDAQDGFAEFNSVMMSATADAAYFGKIVGPSDKDKVLLRWKLDDGKYQVIFGDLHTETATLAEVRALEKPSP